MKIKNNEEGFSLLELVVATGIMLVLVVIGFLLSNDITKDSRQAAVNRAARETYNQATSSILDNDKKTTPKKVEEQYNSSQSNKDSLGNPLIIVKVDELENDNVRVTATYRDDERITATVQSPNSERDLIKEDPTAIPEAIYGLSGCSDETLKLRASIYLDEIAYRIDWFANNSEKNVDSEKFYDFQWQDPECGKVGVIVSSDTVNISKKAMIMVRFENQGNTFNHNYYRMTEEYVNNESMFNEAISYFRALKA